MNAEGFEPHRRRVLGLAYRMLGSRAGAEDVVQEAWLRWTGASGVERPGAWLVTVATRLCLDELKSARVRREEHVGPWLPEPWVEDGPPEPGALGESLSMAFLLLLEELTPRERAAFLLREVFDEDYERVAEVLDTTEANARQLVRRARAAIDTDRPRFDADPAALAALLAAFGVAARSGDLATLEQLLADDVVATADGGGRVKGAGTRPVRGADKVARLVVGAVRKADPRAEFAFAWVNGGPGIVGRKDGVLFAVIAIAVRDGRIVRYDTVLDPLKLARVAQSGQ